MCSGHASHVRLVVLSGTDNGDFLGYVIARRGLEQNAGIVKAGNDSFFGHLWVITRCLGTTRRLNLVQGGGGQNISELREERLIDPAGTPP